MHHGYVPRTLLGRKTSREEFAPLLRRTSYPSSFATFDDEEDPQGYWRGATRRRSSVEKLLRFGKSLVCHGENDQYDFSVRKGSVDPPAQKYTHLASDNFAYRYDAKRGTIVDVDSGEAAGHEGIQYDNPVYVSPETVKMTSLEWLTFPVHGGIENVPLPSFAVQGNPGTTDHLKLTAHSCEAGLKAKIIGQTSVQLRSQGPDKPSVAVFSGIAIHRSGMYALQVCTLGSPLYALVADYPLIIEPEHVRQVPVWDQRDFIQGEIAGHYQAASYSVRAP